VLNFYVCRKQKLRAKSWRGLKKVEQAIGLKLYLECQSLKFFPNLSVNNVVLLHRASENSKERNSKE
jgi:hypothetical protein